PRAGGDRAGAAVARGRLPRPRRGFHGSIGGAVAVDRHREERSDLVLSGTEPQAAPWISTPNAPPTPAAEPAIAVHDLTRAFGAFVAVDHVTFDVARGEVFGFLGPNGAGKT